MTKLDKEIQEGLYDPKMSKQKQFEKQCKAKAHVGKKLKGQQKLTSAVSTSKRLSEYGYDPKQKKISEKRSMILYSQIKNAEEAIELVKKGEHAGYTLKDLPILENRLAKRKAEYDNSYTVVKGYDPVKKKFVVIWGKGERKTFDKLTDAAKYTKHLIKLGNTDAYFTHEETGTLRGYDPMTGTQKEIMAKLKSYGLSTKEAIYYINHPSKLKAEDLIRIGKQRRVFYDPKKKETLSETIMRTSLKELERWEKDFDYGLFETLTEGAKWKLRFAWGYPEGMTPRKYDPKKISFKQAMKEITEVMQANPKLTPSEAETIVWKKHTGKAYDPKTSSLPPTRWYEAMVKGIKKSSDVRNPYAIVKSIWVKLSPKGKAKIRAREVKGEHFKYDLPLPVDKPTKGTGTVRMVKPFKLAEVQVNLSVADYLTALKSGIFSRMKRQDGTTALVARCKSPVKNVNIFVDKAGT